MSEPATPTSSGQQELQEELDRSREEILRLRDLLIGMESELGAAKGRLAELEDPRVLVLAAKQQLTTRALGRLSGIVVRLRGNS